MTDRVNSLWPFTTRAAVLAVPVILVTLIVTIAVTRAFAGWPSAASENVVLIGVLAVKSDTASTCFDRCARQTRSSTRVQGIEADLISGAEGKTVRRCGPNQHRSSCRRC